MSGGVVFRQGGPLSWLCTRQDQTALSSGEAKIHATNEASKSVVGMRHLAESVWSSGFDILDTLTPSLLYNDNAACIQWSHNMTSTTLSVNGSRIKLWMSSMSVDVSIPLTFSPKRCGTGHTFGGCGILSCVAYLNFFSSHFWSSIISRSHLLTRLLVRWYPWLHLWRQLLHKIVILRLCVPFPYAEPSQPFLICRVRVISLYDTFITLFCRVCSEIQYGKNDSFSAHCSWTQGWGVLFHVYLEGIFDIPCGIPRQRATWSFHSPLA
jgi:hypothetical protein